MEAVVVFEAFGCVIAICLSIFLFVAEFFFIKIMASLSDDILFTT